MKELILKTRKYSSKCRVLYVEDDPGIRDATNNFLNKLFPSVTVAVNGSEGLEFYKQHAYDLVVTDIRMPKMDGVEMITHIKEMNEHQAVLVTSAHNEPEYIIPLINLGVERFVLKPFDYKKFIQVIFKIVRNIYIHKQKEVLEQRLVKEAKQTQAILDLIDNAIVVINEQGIIKANRRFFDITGAPREHVNEEVENICDLFVENEECISGLSNKELIVFLQENGKKNHKVKIKRGSVSRDYILKHVKVPDLPKYVLTFTDITEIEKELKVDEVTGLPLKSLVLDFYEALTSEVDGIEVLLFSIKNIHQVTKWHGIEARNQALKMVSEAVSEKLNEGFDAPLYTFGIYGRNKFIILGFQGIASAMKESLKKLSLTHTHEGVSIEKKHIKLLFEAKLLEFLEHKEIHDFDSEINDEFNSIEALLE